LYNSANFHSLYAVNPAVAASTTPVVAAKDPSEGAAPTEKYFHYVTYTASPAVAASAAGVTPVVVAKAAVTYKIVTLGNNAVLMAMSFATLLISASFF
jgi:hypothetical protein